MSAKYTGKDQDRRYEGEQIDITYNVKRCIHAKECVSHLAEVFDIDKRPWINANGANGERIATTINACPSGALHYDRKDGGEAEVIPSHNTVKLLDNGQLQIQGNLRITGATVDLQETRATLCRCGASKNKPFCDNSHREIGFQASAPTATQKTVLDEVGGQLHITVHENGSLELQGNVEIVNEAGETLFAGQKTWLCRCGGSAKKPFCDGTHNRINFKAD